MFFSFSANAQEIEHPFLAPDLELNNLADYIEAQRNVCNELQEYEEATGRRSNNPYAQLPYEPMIGFAERVGLKMELSERSNYKEWKKFLRTSAIYVWFELLDGEENRRIRAITRAYTGQEVIPIKSLFKEGQLYAVCGKKADISQIEEEYIKEAYKNDYYIHAGTLRPIDKSILEETND